VNADSIRDPVDRDREFPFSAMVKGAIPLPIALCSQGFANAARFDSIDPLANLAGVGCVVQTLARLFRRFASVATIWEE